MRRPRVDVYVVAWLAYFAVTVASALANYPYLNFQKGIIDTIGCVVVALMFYSVQFDSKRQMDGLFLAIVSGVVVAALWGFARLYGHTDEYARLQLPGAGSVTQSSIEVGIALICCLRLRASLESIGQGRLSPTTASLIVFLVSILLVFTLVIMSARGSILGTVLALGVVLFFARKKITARHWKITTAAVLAIVTMGLIAPSQWLSNANLTGKITGQLSTGRLDFNDQLRVLSQYYGWHLYLQAGKPLLGVGPRNFAQASSSVPKEISQQIPEFQPPFHAHNFVLTKLAEEGIFGVAALAWILGLVGLRLWRDRADAKLINDWAWPLAVSAWIIPVVSCSFNAPWFQEHAQLAAASFSLYLQQRNALA